jgi:hypothetical protein
MIGWNGSNTKSFSASRVILVGRESKGDRVRPGGLLEGVSCNGENATICVVRCCNEQASVKRQSNDSYAPVQTATSSKPKPEMERLAFLVGTWNASDTYEKSKFAPNRGTGPVFTAALRGWADSLSCPSITTQVRRGESSGYQVLTLDPKQRHCVGYIVTRGSARMHSNQGKLGRSEPGSFWRI